MQEEFELNYQNVVDNHKKYVEQLNELLDKKVEKVEVDKTLLKKLEDKDIAETIKIAEELRIKREKQLKIFDDFKSNYPDYNSKVVGDFIYSSFLTENTEAAKNYNKKLFEDYLANPDKYVFKHFNKLFSVKGRDLYKLQTPLDYAKFYKDNYEAIEMASCAKRNANIILVNYKIRQNLPTLDRFFKLVEYSKRQTERYETPEMLALPEFTKEQAKALNDMILKNPFNNVDENLIKKVNLALTEDDYKEPRKYLEKLSIHISKPKIVKQKKIDPDTNKPVYRTVKKDKPKDFFKDVDKFMTNFVATTQDGKKRIDLDTYLNPGDDKDVKLNVVFGCKNLDVDSVTEKFKETYLENWESRFVKQRGKTGFYSIEQIESEHSGSIIEKLRNSTSPQYKAMIKALRDFGDKDSDRYLDYEYLKSKAKAYIAHKESQGYGTIKRYSGTPLIRKNLAETIIAMEKNHDRIFEEAKKDYLANEIELPKKQLFENPKVIEEKIEPQKEEGPIIIGPEEVKKITGINHDTVEDAMIENYMDIVNE